MIYNIYKEVDRYICKLLVYKEGFDKNNPVYDEDFCKEVTNYYSNSPVTLQKSIIIDFLNHYFKKEDYFITYRNKVGESPILTFGMDGDAMLMENIVESFKVLWDSIKNID
jgi:hypothetical protein